MENKYRYFLISGKYVEPKIISELSKISGFGATDLIKFFINKNKDLNMFIKHYEENMCPFEKELAKADRERVMALASVDCSFEYLEDSSYADAGLEELDTKKL